MSRTLTCDRVEGETGYLFNSKGQFQSFTNFPFVPPVISNYITGNKFVTLPYNSDWYTLSKWGYRFADSQVVMPDVVDIEFDFGEKPPVNIDFERRKSAGEVVVSSLRRDKLSLSIQPGFTLAGNERTWNNTDMDQVAKKGVLPVYWIANRWCVKYGELYWSGTYHTVYKDGDVKFEKPVITHDLWKQVTNPPSFVTDPGALQSVVANCNKRSVDLLTALAELPESVMMVVDALKLITGGLKAFTIDRDKTLKKMKDYIAKRKNAFEKRMSEMRPPDVIRPRSQRPSDVAWAERANARALRRYNANISRERKNLAKDIKVASIKCADTITSSWMMYRYGIMPNVYLIQDLAKASKSLGQKRVSEHSNTDQALAMPVLNGFDISGTSILRQRAWTQNSLDVSDNPLSQLLSVASFNVLTTGYELVPYSWMLDWVLDVGNLLAAINPPTNLIQNGTTESFKYYLFAVAKNKSNGSLYTLRREIYYRDVKSTADFAGIHWNIQMNWKRYLDLAAVSWQKGIKPILTSLSRK